MTKKIIIITAPSGSGKTSIVHALLNQMPALTFSVSATTRSPRTGEEDGIDYYFISVEQFQEKIKQNAFAEYEMVYEGKYYGTLTEKLEVIWTKKNVPLIDIDVQGALKLKEKFDADALSIFIQAPSIKELRNRLIKRGTETEKTLMERIGKAEEEMSVKNNFDTIVVNDKLEEAVLETRKCIEEFIAKP